MDKENIRIKIENKNKFLFKVKFSKLGVYYFKIELLVVILVNFFIFLVRLGEFLVGIIIEFF